MFTAGIPGALERLKSLKAARKEKRKKEKDRRDASQRQEKNDTGSEVPMDSATSMENIKRAKLDHPPPCEGKKKTEKKKSEGKKSEKKKCEGKKTEQEKCEEKKTEQKKCEGIKTEQKKCEGSSLETAPALVQDVVQDLRDCKEVIDEKLRAAFARFGGDYDQEQQEMEGSNTPQDSASQVVGGAEDNNRKRSRDERLGETSTYDQRPKDLFVGESPCRIDVSTVSARMLITDWTKGPRNKMNKPTYVYGNYPNYYGVRTEDSRIEAFKKKWFYGLDCLDVGCHEGKFTLEIVKKFRPKSMMGVDIDRTLVLEKARKNQKKTLSSVSQWEEADEESTESKRETMKSLHNTRFFAGDYALKEGAPECMDTITCFSVIKWIHFHHGDDGIKFVFKKIFNALRPGGFFILEPQSWESYAKAKRKQNMFGVPYYNLKLLKLHPSDFLDHLINEVGFKHVKSLAFPDADEGFSRPIFILRKPKHTV